MIINACNIFEPIQKLIGLFYQFVNQLFYDSENSIRIKCLFSIWLENPTVEFPL